MAKYYYYKIALIMILRKLILSKLQILNILRPRVFLTSYRTIDKVTD